MGQRAGRHRLGGAAERAAASNLAISALLAELEAEYERAAVQGDDDHALRLQCEALLIYGAAVEGELRRLWVEPELHLVSNFLYDETREELEQPALEWIDAVRATLSPLVTDEPADADEARAAREELVQRAVLEIAGERSTALGREAMQAAAASVES